MISPPHDTALSWRRDRLFVLSAGNAIIAHSLEHILELLDSMRKGEVTMRGAPISLVDRCHRLAGTDGIAAARDHRAAR